MSSLAVCPMRCLMELAWCFLFSLLNKVSPNFIIIGSLIIVYFMSSFVISIMILFLNDSETRNISFPSRSNLEETFTFFIQIHETSLMMFEKELTAEISLAVYTRYIIIDFLPLDYFLIGNANCSKLSVQIYTFFSQKQFISKFISISIIFYFYFVIFFPFYFIFDQ